MKPNPENPDNKTESTARGWNIPADLMPRRVAVVKSTVKLLVAGKLWNGQNPVAR